MKFQTLCENVTEFIISELEKGNAIWKTPWKSYGAARNFFTGRPYTGFNQFYLSMIGEQRSYNMTAFATFKQITTANYKVRKGAKGIPVVYWLIGRKPTGLLDGEGNEQTKQTFFPITHYVFNVADIEGLEIKEQQEEAQVFSPLDICEDIVQQMPFAPEIRHGGSKAYYSKVSDYVQVPNPEDFITNGHFYATLFHELIHSTGHSSRLNRFAENETSAPFGSAEYSKEELTAEMGAAFLCAQAGIENSELSNNSVAYLENWLQVLRNDKTFIVYAAQRAIKAATFILGDKVGSLEDEPMETEEGAK